MQKLKGKIAVVTGATSGIGLAISYVLLKQGVKTYLIGRDFKRLNEKIKTDSQLMEKACFVAVDMHNDKEIEKITNETKAEDKIDILVHCAGIISVGSVEDDTINHLDEQYRVNVRAPYLITQRLLPKIKKAAGDIVFINSTTGLDAWEEVGQYAATKHALKAIADSLRKELKSEKVRVSSIYLGSVDTPMQQKVQQLKKKRLYQPENFIPATVIADVVLHMITLPAQAMVTDITLRQNT